MAPGVWAMLPLLALVLPTSAFAGGESPLVCAAEGSSQEKACNVCLECCRDYIEGEVACRKCVEEECRPRPWKGPGFGAKMHFAPDCLRYGGWHDIQALSYKGINHVWFGCDFKIGGWGHSTTDDFVAYKMSIGGPRKINERYGEFHSFATPCSGFVAVDHDGVACAGFRQCSSDRGPAGMHNWDAPLEVRCALDDNLTVWGEPEYLFNVSYYRGIPYDPTRPWKEKDGMWYLVLATDACNSTTNKIPCPLGGQLIMYKSAFLHGPKAKWERIGPVFTSNKTVLSERAYLDREMVTVEYIGGLTGDPNGGSTRVLFNNVAGPNCCGGTTSYTIVTNEPGKAFVVNGSSNFEGLGMVDWGVFEITDYGKYGRQALEANASAGKFMMARVLGSTDPNQVAVPGRRVMVGWLYSSSASLLSMSRELSLSKDLELLQKFPDSLQNYRIQSSRKFTSDTQTRIHPTPLAEVVGEFTIESGNLGGLAFGVAVFGCEDGTHTKIGVLPENGLVTVDGIQQKAGNPKGGPLLPMGTKQVRIHAVLDNGIIEVIFNNRTAITAAVTPGSQASCGKAWLYGADGKDVVGRLEAYTLKPANQI
eukprot:CAMPEP_0197532572 /NCGR_PEP_ID=MMETSP1318-20131121/40238_1 /TAXON_ID=552666 /ORGANISM="Partenskyella glossopodia, Strain RCC365" /LENGTH=591 /DNA_ID=CAMNT_0043089181 /DNA_START=17 /DNA_END=1792 /DNA_ORIENTATION=-